MVYLASRGPRLVIIELRLRQRLKYINFPMKVVLKIAGAFLLLTHISLSIYAQSAHSRLTDKAQLERFDAISRKIMCTCGCNMPLKYCNHTGHCNAWPARAVIDQLILQGKSDAEIIEGFKNGFGAAAVQTPVFSLAQSNEYRYMLEKFQNGFGSTIFSAPESAYLGWISLFAAMTILGVAAIYIKRRSGRQSPQRQVSAGNDLETQKRHQAMLDRLEKED